MTSTLKSLSRFMSRLVAANQELFGSLRPGHPVVLVVLPDGDAMSLERDDAARWARFEDIMESMLDQGKVVAYAPDRDEVLSLAASSSREDLAEDFSEPKPFLDPASVYLS